MLETIDLDFESDHKHTFETRELTCNCPFDFGGPDFYHCLIRYEPDEKGVEARSLKKYFESFRDEEMVAERLGEKIYGDIYDAIEPEKLYVRLEQARRGGIEEVCEVGDNELY